MVYVSREMSDPVLIEGSGIVRYSLAREVLVTNIGDGATRIYHFA